MESAKTPVVEVARELQEPLEDLACQLVELLDGARDTRRHGVIR